MLRSLISLKYILSSQQLSVFFRVLEHYTQSIWLSINILIHGIECLIDCSDTCLMSFGALSVDAAFTQSDQISQSDHIMTS